MRVESRANRELSSRHQRTRVWVLNEAEKISALFSAYRRGSSSWWGHVSVLSGHEWETLMTCWGRSHPPCSCCRKGFDSCRFAYDIVHESELLGQNTGVLQLDMLAHVDVIFRHRRLLGGGTDGCDGNFFSLGFNRTSRLSNVHLLILVANAESTWRFTPHSSSLINPPTSQHLYFALKMETVWISEMLSFPDESTRHQTPEKQHHNPHRREHLKSHTGLQLIMAVTVVSFHIVDVERKCSTKQK
jgi:hypothetical protein